MFDVNPDIEHDLRIISHIHDQIIEASGGAKGIRSEHLLKSALVHPFQAKLSIEEIAVWLKVHGITVLRR